MNATSNEAITLPKGGGAQHGMGEKFSPDLHTGTVNFTIPIALPSGRNSFQPELSIDYNTSNGNGQFGFGWNPSIPSVGRKISKGDPRFIQDVSADLALDDAGVQFIYATATGALTCSSQQLSCQVFFCSASAGSGTGNHSSVSEIVPSRNCRS